MDETGAPPVRPKAKAVSTGSQIPPEKVKRYFAARGRGSSITAAAKEAKIARGTAVALERRAEAERANLFRSKNRRIGTSAGSGSTSRQTMSSGRAGHGNPWANGYLLGDEALPGPKAYAELGDEAKAALGDFALFRRRYFGRGPAPWQVDAGERIASLLAAAQESREREFLVLNAPPSAGKSTIWHDLCVWLICRDRSIRILYGSRTTNQAIKYTRRIRRSLVQRDVVWPDEQDLALGLAVEPEGLLVEDFGRFKPAGRSDGDVWQMGGFTVCQPGDLLSAEKEPTVTAFGFDADYMGMRVDLAIWDDLVDPANVRTAEVIEKLQEDWDNVAEARTDPGGLCVLQGQRIRHNDLYRYCLDKRRSVDEEVDEDGEFVPKYRHIVYPAHMEELCRGLHKRSDPAYDPKRRDQGGCLLDPRRIPWRDVKTWMSETPDMFRVVYQQEDLDPGSALIQRVWVDGGKDPVTNALYTGCWDHDRSMWQLPPAGAIPAPNHLALVVDPSPSNWWACIAEGSLVTTLRGEVPIENIGVGQLVATRAGWKPVLAKAMTGVKPTVELRLSNGRRLSLTSDHRVATPSGWVEAGRLLPGDPLVVADHDAGSAVALTLVDPQVLAGEGVPALAMGLGGLACGQRFSAQRVHPSGHGFEVGRFDAGFVAAQVVQLEPFGDRADVVAVRQPVGEAFAVAAEARPHPPVSGRVALPAPFPAAGGADGGAGPPEGVVDGDGVLHCVEPVGADLAALRGCLPDLVPATTQAHVVSVVDGCTTPVWDLEVAGAHEFVAEGVVVHNCQLWLTNQASERRYLLAVERRRMTAPEFLDWDADRACFSGFLEEWWVRSAEMGMPFRYVVLEVNAAQKWLLQYDHAKRWAQKRSVNYVPHTTGIQKTDSTRGIPAVKGHWRSGRIRLPGNPDGSRQQSMLLVNEMLRWPHGATDDQVMAHWFNEHQLPKLAPPRPVAVRRQRRPSWLRRSA